MNGFALMLHRAEVPNSPVAAGMVTTDLPTPGAMAYALGGRWALLPKEWAIGATTATQDQLEPLMPAPPIVLGAHVIAPPQARISGLGGTQTGDIATRGPLYDPGTRMTGYLSSAPPRAYGYGI